MSREKGYRGLFYTIGLLILALGLTFNSKAGLGVSALTSVAYCTSQIWQWNYGDTTLVVYCIFVAAQFVMKGRKAWPYDLLQIPMSLVFTRLLNLYGTWFRLELTILWQKVLLLLASIVLIGVGAAMMLAVRLVPNPCDGIVQALSDKTGKEIGLTKNLFDLFNVTVTFFIGAATGNFMLGIGLGTVIGVFGVGRVMALFNRLCKEKILRLSGMEG